MGDDRWPVAKAMVEESRYGIKRMSSLWIDSVGGIINGNRDTIVPEDDRSYVPCSIMYGIGACGATMLQHEKDDWAMSHSMLRHLFHTRLGEHDIVNDLPLFVISPAGGDVNSPERWLVMLIASMARPEVVVFQKGHALEPDLRPGSIVKFDPQMGYQEVATHRQAFKVISALARPWQVFHLAK